LRKRIAVITGVIAAIVATAAVFGAVATKPADALPTYGGACSASGCHTSTPTGAVSAQASQTTLSPGAAYTVTVTIPFTNTGRYGARIDNAGGVAQAHAGPQAGNPIVVNVTAPSAAGTYTYTAWGVRGAPGGGQAASTTYQITVQSNAGGGTVTDTVAPTAVAQAATSVKKGKTATLKYKVTDPQPNLGTASATITIKNAKGKVVKKLVLTAKPVNTPQKATFKATLKKGKYKFYVTAVDAAGNHSTNISFKKLTVK
jgi:hypothetical protein